MKNSELELFVNILRNVISKSQTKIRKKKCSKKSEFVEILLEKEKNAIVSSQFLSIEGNNEFVNNSDVSECRNMRSNESEMGCVKNIEYNCSEADKDKKIKFKSDNSDIHQDKNIKSEVQEDLIDRDEETELNDRKVDKIIYLNDQKQDISNINIDKNDRKNIFLENNCDNNNEIEKNQHVLKYRDYTVQNKTKNQRDTNKSSNTYINSNDNEILLKNDLKNLSTPENKNIASKEEDITTDKESISQLLTTLINRKSCEKALKKILKRSKIHSLKDFIRYTKKNEYLQDDRKIFFEIYLLYHNIFNNFNRHINSFLFPDMQQNMNVFFKNGGDVCTEFPNLPDLIYKIVLSTAETVDECNILEHRSVVYQIIQQIIDGKTDFNSINEHILWVLVNKDIETCYFSFINDKTVGKKYSEYLGEEEIEKQTLINRKLFDKVTCSICKILKTINTNVLENNLYCIYKDKKNRQTVDHNYLKILSMQSQYTIVENILNKKDKKKKFRLNKYDFLYKSHKNNFSPYNYTIIKYFFNAEIFPHLNAITCILSVNNMLITASDDHVIKIWDIDSLFLKASLIRHCSFVNDICVSIDSSLLASVDGDGFLCIWDLQKFILLYEVSFEGTVELVEFIDNINACGDGSGSNIANNVCSFDVTYKRSNETTNTSNLNNNSNCKTNDLNVKNGMNSYADNDFVDLFENVYNMRSDLLERHAKR
ncbi:hypothetical protein EDEG_02887 [Edhazardia aedis USNM 41457]|uniref:Uncharacterized protein n=1 Tax=Edhazardia aedis (strain USNM 41457) TaxID=1003232 RepID=J8ZSR3_EDHAE|nr:hypothetical protein EDEG_02887 [Edhazardia aedis USNM 41457]|eukprot:EJW02703.1 hypothetical protein EDEG_02887 [Edhazardia aedis USNM 41457]